jgi:uncharacterized membrane protein YphA (DoxX/SURF4 family)
MNVGDTSWLATAGRLLLGAFLPAVGIRNLQRHHIDDHVKRLTNFKAPFPVVTFWTGQTMEFVGCALVLFDWHAAIGVSLLLVFTIGAAGLLLRFWEVEGPMRTGMQNGMLANVGIGGGLRRQYHGQVLSGCEPVLALRFEEVPGATRLLARFPAVEELS